MGWGQIIWETGIEVYTLVYVKHITYMGLLDSTGNLTHYSIMTYMGKESKKGRTYVDA